MAILSKNTTIGGRIPLTIPYEYEFDTVGGLCTIELTGDIDANELYVSGHYVLKNVENITNFPNGIDLEYINSVGLNLIVLTNAIQKCTQYIINESHNLIRYQINENEWTEWTDLIDSVKEKINETKEQLNKKINTLELFGTSDIYELQEGIDYKETVMHENLFGVPFSFSIENKCYSLINTDYSKKSAIKFPDKTESIPLYGTELIAKKVIFPESVKSIGIVVPNGVITALDIYVLNSNTTIIDNTFSKNTIIYGYKDSTAETYANEYSHMFIELNDGCAQTIQFLNLKNELETKVDKVEGKGLSTEDFTTEAKKRLEGLNTNGIFGSGHTINYGNKHLVSGSNNTVDGGWTVALLGSQLRQLAGNQAFLTGYNHINSGGYAVIGGNGNISNGVYNVLFGLNVNALQGYNVMLGNNLESQHSHCNLIGEYLQGVGYRKTILGRYNAPSNNPFVVAYGNDDANRKNIFEVTENCKAIATGYEGEYIILKSPNGKKFKLTVNDNGELVTEGV